MKFINSKVHGGIDYLVDLVFLFAPTVFAFSPLVSTICYVVAAVHFTTSLCTKYEWGMFKLIPFPVHGGIELGASIALALMPWIAGFSGEGAATNFFVGSGITIFLVWLTTNYRSAQAVADVRTGDFVSSSDGFEWRKTG